VNTQQPTSDRGSPQPSMCQILTAFLQGTETETGFSFLVPGFCGSGDETMHPLRQCALLFPLIQTVAGREGSRLQHGAWRSWLPC